MYVLPSADVKSSTRGSKTLDLLYTNVKEAYNCTVLPPHGNADHNLVHLKPLNKSVVLKQDLVKWRNALLRL